MTDEQKQKLEEIENLEFGWFDINRSEVINKTSIRFSNILLDLLPEDFEIFPLSDGSIQIECTRNIKYIEICIFENKFTIYWQITAINEDKILAEGEDLFIYNNEEVFNRIVNFVNFFFNEL